MNESIPIELDRSYYVNSVLESKEFKSIELSV